MYHLACRAKRRIKRLSILILPALLMLVQVSTSRASERVLVSSLYSVEVCENGIWKTLRSEMIYAGNSHLKADGILAFMPLKQFVAQKKLPSVKPAEDFSYRISLTDPEVTLRHSYLICDDQWEIVLRGESAAPDLSSLDSGKYLLAVQVSAKKDDGYAQTKHLVWLIVGDYEEQFTFKLTGRRRDAFSILTYCGSDTHVEIPSVYQGFPVTQIEKSAFEGTAIEELVLPSSVQSIGEQAFPESCTLLVVPGSYAEDYAKRRYIPYRLLDESLPEE